MKLAKSGRTLIVQPLPGIGDMVWHLPHIHAIAATTLTGQVDILTKRGSLADRLLCADPSVDRVLWLERDGRHASWRDLPRLVALLRRGRYQRMWILHDSVRYALAARLARIPERVGYGVGLQALLQNGPVRLPPGQRRHVHPIVRADALLGLLGVTCNGAEPLLVVAAEAERAVAARFAVRPRPWIALGIGSSQPWKQWGAARFAELGLALLRGRAASVFIVGGAAERSLADDITGRICAGGGEVSDAVALPLEQTAALLAQCRRYVGNDTGVLNMAAALRVSAIGLFGGSPPLWHSRFIHPLVPPPGEREMAAIAVAHVLEMLDRLDEMDGETAKLP